MWVQLWSLNPYSIGRYSLRANDYAITASLDVLILILLEDTLWVIWNFYMKFIIKSLNPYSIGRYSLRVLINNKIFFHICLNPYSIGRYSLRRAWMTSVVKPNWRLNPYSIGRYSLRCFRVCGRGYYSLGLNPYSIGRYSLRLRWNCFWTESTSVLILILLEDTLWVNRYHSVEVK